MSKPAQWQGALSIFMMLWVSRYDKKREAHEPIYDWQEVKLFLEKYTANALSSEVPRARTHVHSKLIAFVASTSWSMQTAFLFNLICFAAILLTCFANHLKVISTLSTR